MKLTRTIHPIGQGGFYTETLKDGDDEINVVYDCGGNSEAFMQNYLDPKKNNVNPNIDAVFISHFHEDHINGLEYLLNNYNVKTLFLPQLEDDEKFEVILYNLSKRSSFASKDTFIKFVINLMNNNFSFKDIRIIRIPHGNDNSTVNADLTTDCFDITDEKIDDIINVGTKITFQNKWLFIPYNPPYTPSWQKGNDTFDVYFKNKFGELSIDELPDFYKNNTDACKKAYYDYYTDPKTKQSRHNPYSMTLFSGIAEALPIQKPSNDFWKNPIILQNPNCLYMGDFELKGLFKKLQQVYGIFWETIATVQVPHHGSRNNFFPALYDSPSYGIVSVGEHNKHHLPNLDTLTRIKGKNCLPIIVTETSTTKRVFLFDLNNQNGTNGSFELPAPVDGN